MNVILFHILDINSGNICGTEREIGTKCLSEINTIRIYELISMNKR